MAVYHRLYDSRHLQADCHEPGSAPEPYAQQSVMGYRNLLPGHNGPFWGFLLCGSNMLHRCGEIWQGERLTLPCQISLIGCGPKNTQFFKINFTIFGKIPLIGKSLAQFLQSFQSLQETLLSIKCYKKLSYRRVTARCVLSVVILPIPRNSAETTYTTSPDQTDGMKLEI